MTRAVGIVRQSKSSEEALSPAEQRLRITEHCAREGLELVEVREELDVSGGTPLAKRVGLRGAVEAVEGGKAEVVVVAYFDRLVRSLTVQAEVVERVEAAGGRVVAVDFGEISSGTAAQWISATTLGMVAEYWRRSVGERSRAAQAQAVARGVLPYPHAPPGYRKAQGQRLVPNEDAPVVADAFRRRAEGATIREVRAFLRGNGIERTYRGVGSLLRSRVVLGEIHFGELVNREAHEPIVDREVWEAVQRAIVPRGRKPVSDRLLARLGVLRCASCGAKLGAGSQRRKDGRRYFFYRCPPTGDCSRRVTVSASLVEGIVVDAVRSVLRDEVGRASSERKAREAEVEAERAQADLEAAIRAFGGLEEEAVARERLTELRQARDVLVERAHRLDGLRAGLTISADADWDRLTQGERRALIRAVVDRVEVAPGRGPDRVTVQLVSEDAAGGPVEDAAG